VGEGWHGSGILGVLYIGRGNEVRGRGRKSGGQRWELGQRLLMAPFRVGEEMGEGEMEGEGRGEDGAAAPFWVEWRGTVGEPVAGGE
jgi:hypothetical protein